MKRLRPAFLALVFVLLTVVYLNLHGSMPRDFQDAKAPTVEAPYVTPVAQNAAPAAAVVEEPSGPVTGAPETSVRVSAPASPPPAPDPTTVPSTTTTTLPSSYLAPDGQDGYAKVDMGACYDADNHSAPPLACPPGVPPGTGIHL